MMQRRLRGLVSGLDEKMEDVIIQKREHCRMESAWKRA
jgi:hypothetical protein